MRVVLLKFLFKSTTLYKLYRVVLLKINFKPTDCRFKHFHYLLLFLFDLHCNYLKQNHVCLFEEERKISVSKEDPDGE